jgi:hypothetical protein
MSANTFETINLAAYSKLHCDAAVSSDSAVLLLRFSGDYRPGSDGNGDGLFMAAMTAAYCSLFDPTSLVLDLLHLNYRWGNTIARTTNFFWETGRDDDERSRSVVIVATGATRSALESLDRQVTSGTRSYAESVDRAVELAEAAAREYLA